MINFNPEDLVPAFFHFKSPGVGVFYLFSPSELRRLLTLRAPAWAVCACFLFENAVLGVKERWI